MIGRLGRLFAATVGRRRFERAMADEMADHIARRTEDLVREGLAPAEAKRRARLEFGGIEGTKDACREARRLDYGDELVRNLRHAARAFSRVPVLLVTIVVTLGLGIGANVAIWSVVDSVLLRPLPYPQSDRLVTVETRFGADGEIADRAGSQDGRTWEALENGVRGLDLAVYSDWPSGGNVVADSVVEYLDVQKIGAGFFRVLGIAPVLGREPTPQEDVPGGPALAVLSHALWQRLYGGDPDVLGRTLLLRGEPHEIIGVMPEAFQTSVDADLWTPLRPSTTGEGEGTNYDIIGRLRPGVDWLAADAEVRAAGAAVMATRGAPEGMERWLGIEPLKRAQTRDVRQRLLISWAIIATVLIVACINVAGLLLAHAARRSNEIATRMALGGGRSAILRQLLTESLAISALGTIAGLGIGAGLIHLLRQHAAIPLGLWQPIGIDGRVIVVAVALAALTVLLCGLYPAIAASRLDLRSAQRTGDPNSSLEASWLRRALVVAQLAVVVALLVGAGLMVRTLFHLEGLESGFDPDQVFAATVSLQDARYDTVAEAEALLESVAARLRAQPEIEAAAAGLNLPYERPLNMGVVLDGEDRSRITHLTYVTPTFFETLGVGLVRGRFLDARDRRDAAPVAVVNRAFVDTYLAGRDPLGLRLGTAGAEREIVGVVADLQQRPSWGGTEPIARRAAIFVPLSQTSDDFLRLVHGWFPPSWVVRAATADTPVGDRVRAALEAVDPRLPLIGIRTIEAVRDEVLVDERFQAVLLVTASAIALLLAAVGLGGLIAASVAERTRELGIRMALGADRLRTLRTAALPGIRLSLVGLGLGLVLAAGTVGVLRAFVFGVSVFDLRTYAMVAGVLLAVATVASLLPSLRLLRLDPARVLRAE